MCSKKHLSYANAIRSVAIRITKLMAASVYYLKSTITNAKNESRRDRLGKIMKIQRLWRQLNN